MVVIGITGNIGSGKSLVAEIIREAGFVVSSSDEIAKRLMSENKEIIIALQKVFGDDIYDSEGKLDKAKLAEIVFGDTPEHDKHLKELNRIVHPHVLAEHERQIEEYSEKGTDRLFIESALIFEAQIEDAFDYIVVVDASEELRIKRIQERDGRSLVAIKQMMKSQISSEQKVKQADFVIDNSSTKDSLKQSVSVLLPILSILPAVDLDNDESTEEPYSE